MRYLKDGAGWRPIRIAFAFHPGSNARKRCLSRPSRFGRVVYFNIFLTAQPDGLGIGADAYGFDRLNQVPGKPAGLCPLLL